MTEQRPSDGMTLDELRDEFDWICEFQSRMAERIRGDADVHNLVDYVRKLEADRERMFRACVEKNQTILRLCDERARLREMCRRLFDELYTLVDDNFSDVYTQYEPSDVQPFYDELRELGIEVDA